MKAHQSARLRVPWDGPNPDPGDYLASRVPGRSWLILAVEPMRHHDADGARLTLDLRAAVLPAGAVLHPWTRAAAYAVEGPARVRQLAHGPTAVMASAWRDPGDTRPNAAREARKVHAFRTACPLRGMKAIRGSQVTKRHIDAADHFRQLADLATFGWSSPEDPTPVSAIAYGPRLGPSAAAVDRASASASVTRFLARLAKSQHAMIVEIVLLNRSVHSWSRDFDPPLDRDIEVGRLLAVLEILADEYADEVDAKADRDDTSAS